MGACPNLAGELAWMAGWMCERATWATMQAGPRWLAIPTCITIAGGERAVMARAVKWAPSRAPGGRVTVTKPPASSTAMAPTGAAGPIAGRHTSPTALAARCCAPAGIVPGASSARRLGAHFRFDTDVCGLHTPGALDRSTFTSAHLQSRTLYVGKVKSNYVFVLCKAPVNTVREYPVCYRLITGSKTPGGAAADNREQFLYLNLR